MNNLNDIFFAPAEDSSMTYDQILDIGPSLIGIGEDGNKIL